MSKFKGVIYILTNPSFPEYVKIGYADNVEERLKQLNASPAVPYGFRIYAVYDVEERLEDLRLHRIIDNLNPSLRCVDDIDGKQRTKEFFKMSKEDAYDLFYGIAIISGTIDRLHRWETSPEDKLEEEKAEEVREKNINRHHFKEIEFYSSLTDKEYVGKTADDGTLCLIEKETGNLVAKRANPSIKQIVGQALIDLGEVVNENETTYQRYHRLTRIKS